MIRENSWKIIQSGVLKVCYITGKEHEELMTLCHEIGRILGAMMTSPEKFLV